MTSTLERAISEVETLPEAEQNEIADLILTELEDRKQWDQQFAATQEPLSAGRRKFERTFAPAKFVSKESMNCEIPDRGGRQPTHARGWNFLCTAFSRAGSTCV